MDPVHPASNYHEDYLTDRESRALQDYALNDVNTPVSSHARNPSVPPHSHDYRMTGPSGLGVPGAHEPGALASPENAEMGQYQYNSGANPLVASGGVDQTGQSTGLGRAGVGGALAAGGAQEYEKHRTENRFNTKEHGSYGDYAESRESLPAAWSDHHKGYAGAPLSSDSSRGMMETVTLIDAVSPLTWSQQVAIGVAQALMLASLALMLIWIIEYLGSFVWSTTDPNMLNLHIFFGVVGIALFFFEGVIVQRLYSANHPRGRMHNGLLQLLNLGCLAVALYAVFAVQPSPHMFSLHSWVGAITAGLMALQFLFALFSYILPLGGDYHLVEFTPYNHFLSYASFILGILTLLTGIQSILTLRQTGRYNSYPSQDATSGSAGYEGVRDTGSILGNVLGLTLLGLLLCTIYAVLPRSLVPTVQRPLHAANYGMNRDMIGSGGFGGYETRKSSLSDAAKPRRFSWFRRHENPAVSV